MELLLCALAALKLVDIVKELIPWPLTAWGKSLISLAAAGTFAALTQQRVSDWFLLAVAAAGLASAFHSVIRVISALGDETRQRVILRAANPRRGIQ